MPEPKRSVAALIWEFIRSRGPRGVIADEVLAHYVPEIEHTTVTARIHGLKQAGILVRHPEKLVRKTRKGRTAEVWVVPRGARFERYREQRITKPENVIDVPGCDRAHVTEPELELLEAARTYGELGYDDEDKLDAAMTRLFDLIVKVYPERGQAARSKT